MNIQKENPAQRNRILFFAWFNILSNNVYFFCAAASASAAVFDGVNSGPAVTLTASALIYPSLVCSHGSLETM